MKTRSDGHAALEALSEPPDGEPRVPRTYSEHMTPESIASTRRG
ncbi:hypothetical protein [Halobellus ruber]|nr:hypothetical protein [Halobellus ruber]